MRIAVSVDTDAGLDAVVCPHFGHSPYYALVDVEGNRAITIQTVANPYYPEHTPGAIPQFIHSQGAHVMLTGGMGQRAVAFFEQYGIQPVTGASGTVRQSLEQFLSGQVTGAEPCHESISDCHGEHDHAGGAR
jgi:predicted Fe-Mo cluster-binding NifX family protein